jgi:hypothetical protein
MSVDGESLCPDGAFELRTSDGKQFNFVVEIDCSTERVASPRDADSWQRKIRLYDRLQDLNLPHRFRVLVICTGGRERLRHILSTAATHFRNPQRSLLYGTLLPEFLSQADPLHTKIFHDHLHRAVALVP